MEANEYHGDYYLGLDCGTTSVGWAVTDTDYNVLTFNGKRMMGVRLFDEAKTAADRRMARCSRRRTMRRKERLNILQDLFAEEIDKVDPLFFRRLENSKYFREDKDVDCKYALFGDKEYTDSEYFRDYPTIFHLRYELMNSREYHDPRLVYLAIHHILKNRGHFLFPGENMKAVTDASELLKNTENLINQIFSCDDEDFSFVFGDLSEFQETFRIRRPSERKEKMSAACSCTDKKIGDSIIKLINGNKVQLKNLFALEEDSELFNESVCFKDSDFEDVRLPMLEGLLNDDDRTMLLISLKAIYDYILLADILDGCSSVSEGKIRQYAENRKDLASLKYIFRKYLSEQEYEDYFHSEKKGCFSNYIGVIQDNRTGKKTLRRCSYDEFKKNTSGILKKIKADECDVDILKELSEKLETESLLPLLISSRNSVIPYQLHKMELEAILANASQYLPFLNEKDESGYSVSEKIVMLLTFRIPYYVGPITNSHSSDEQKKYSWLVRREDGKVYPWNFDQKIDRSASAENFINRMKSHCTYLPDFLVIPRNSLLYSKFMVLNEINKLTINGNQITVKQKQDIFDDLYRRNRKVTSKMIKDYAVSKGWASKPVSLGGIDGEPKASLASYYDFRDIIELKRLEWSKVEEIIEKTTLFGDDRSMCLEAISRIAGEALDKDEISEIAKRRYTGWGRLSREFLVGLQAESSRTGEITSIISLLWNTNSNLMEIINDPEYRITDQLKGQAIDKLDYKLVDELYVSPSVKRQIWQTLKVCQELEKVMKRAPAKVFVEVARGDSENSGRTKSRKQALQELYESIRKEGLFKEEIDELSASLDKYSEQDISRQDKLYLYFTQMGRCMYSGERIDIESLYDTNIYDIDHIFPQSLTADDSLSNRVLTLKRLNLLKSNKVPIPEEWRSRMADYWKILAKKELISKEKYRRLTRSEPLSDDELQGFINRQLVEVSQSTKATIDILRRYYGETTSVVFAKARNVSYFRQRFSIPKARCLNDLHHAKDAYLNIVVGNTYMTKFTSNFWKYISDSRTSSESSTSSNIPTWKYNLMKMFDWTVDGAWYPGLTGTIVTVKKECWNDDVRLTKQVSESSGALFDLQLVKGNVAEGLTPAKKITDENISADEWTKRYGGYNKQAVSYFIIAEHKNKKKRDISIFPAYCSMKGNLKTKSEIEQFLIQQHNVEEPRIIIPKLMINDLIEYKGMKMRISGKSSSGILVRMEVPLRCCWFVEDYIHKIEKAFQLKQKNKLSYLPYNRNEISSEYNIMLYDFLTMKAGNPSYINRPSCQCGVLQKGHEKFEGLCIDEQLNVLQNIIRYFSSAPGMNDFSAIGGSANAGQLKFSKTVRTKGAGPKFVVIHQSITGLFEKRTVVK